MSKIIAQFFGALIYKQPSYLMIAMILIWTLKYWETKVPILPLLKIFSSSRKQLLSITRCFEQTPVKCGGLEEGSF